MPSAWEPILLLTLYLTLDLFVALVIQRPAAGAASHAARARRAAAALRVQAKAATSPETFARAAKLERQALAYEREAERADADAGNAVTDPRVKTVATVKTVAGLALALRWWGAPVLALGAGAAWPLGWWAVQPHGRAARAGGAWVNGGVAALPWSALCSRASGALARAVVVGLGK